MSEPYPPTHDAQPQGSWPGWNQDPNAGFYVPPAPQWDQANAPPISPPYPPAGQVPAPEPADGDRGLGKAALAMGTSFFLKNKLSDHNSHQQGHHGFGFNKITGTIGAAGAGAIGAKLFGALTGKTQQQQPPPQQYHPPPPQPPQAQVHVIPVYMSGPQGHPPQGPQGYPPQGHAQGPPQAHQQPMPPPPYHAQQSPPPVGPGAGHFVAGAAAGMAASQLPAMSMGGFAPQAGPPPLYIYGAVYADRDVTQTVRSLVSSQQTLTLKGESLTDHFGDPWPEVGRKMFNVLYAYGDRPMELLAADTNTDNIEIKHEAISKKRMEFVQPPPSRIIAAVWGFDNPLTKQRLEMLEKDGEMEGSGSALGGGSFYNWEPKTLVCYYRTDAGGIGIVFCRDGGTIRLPWNPLAKWS